MLVHRNTAPSVARITTFAASSSLACLSPRIVMIGTQGGR
jgi:hypothetical protein